MIYSLQNMISSRQSPQKGFVILFAVIITSIVLLVSIGISSVIYKETLLSSSSRDGGYAFFAADSGLECALYWDSLGIFDSPAIFDDFTNTNRGSKITCTADVQVNQISPASELIVMQDTPEVYTFLYNSLDNTSCAKVTINKAYPNPVTGLTQTKIDSLGYNLRCRLFTAVGGFPVSRVVERAVGVLYDNPDVSGLGNTP